MTIFLAFLFPLFALSLAGLLCTLPRTESRRGLALSVLAVGGALWAAALGHGLGIPPALTVLPALLFAAGLLLLARHERRVEDARRARESALKSTLEDTSRRAVVLAGQAVGLEVELARLKARLADLEAANDALRKTLAEYEQRLHVLDWRLRHERTLDELEKRNQELEDLSRHDVLTRLYNRRHVDRLLDALAVRHDITELAVGLFDIDHFKAINDRYGHPAGDRVLAEVAGILRRQLRQGDVVGRYGGEEFIVLLARVTTARTVCEKLREAVASYAWEEIAAGLRVTVSAGLAVTRCPFDPRRLVAEADRLLYLAKEGGRNRVVALPPS